MTRIMARLRSGRQRLKYWLQQRFNPRGTECKSPAAHDIPSHAQPVQAETSAPEPEPEQKTSQKLPRQFGVVP